ncbi:hypothetical protein EON63_21520 [archaeon]|nr:MAG: hypothetical protein EON63_21520 [archaeon]
MVILPDQRCSAMDLLTSPYMKAEYDKYIASHSASHAPSSHTHTHTHAPSASAASSPLVSGKKKPPPPPNLLRALSNTSSSK